MSTSTRRRWTQPPLDEHQIVEHLIVSHQQEVTRSEEHLAEHLKDRADLEANLADARAQLAASMRLREALATPRGPQTIVNITGDQEAVDEDRGKAFRGAVEDMTMTLDFDPNAEMQWALGVAPVERWDIPEGWLLFEAKLSRKDKNHILEAWQQITWLDWDNLRSNDGRFTVYGQSCRFIALP